MFYKIENKDSFEYTCLLELLKQIKEINELNMSKVKRKVEIPFKSFVINNNPLIITNVFKGFIFEDKENICNKTWKFDKELECYVPNKRTNKGREMSYFLNILPVISYKRILFCLKITNDLLKFKIPKVYQMPNDFTIYLILDDNHIPDEKNVIEITRKEFLKALNLNL